MFLSSQQDIKKDEIYVSFCFKISPTVISLTSSFNLGNAVKRVADSNVEIDLISVQAIQR